MHGATLDIAVHVVTLKAAVHVGNVDLNLVRHAWLAKGAMMDPSCFKACVGIINEHTESVTSIGSRVRYCLVLVVRKKSGW